MVEPLFHGPGQDHALRYKRKTGGKGYQQAAEIYFNQLKIAKSANPGS